MYSKWQKLTVASTVATAVDEVVIVVDAAMGASAHTVKAEEAESFVERQLAGGFVADEDQYMKKLANELIKEVDWVLEQAVMIETYFLMVAAKMLAVGEVILVRNCVAEMMSAALCMVFEQQLASCYQRHVAVAVSGVASAVPVSAGVVFDAAGAAFAGEVAGTIDVPAVSAAAAMAVGVVESA